MSDNSANATFSEIAALPFDSPDKTFQYGADSLQNAEYWSSAPNSPLLMLIHGGCWLNQYDLSHIRPLASALSQQGIAVLSVEYRRIGDVGGGYPGTFDDLNAAAAFAAGLEHEQLYVAGHSAGGHLALWLTATSELNIRGAIGLAAISDLETYARGTSGCEQATAKLLGGMPEEAPARYLTTSPQRLEFTRPVALLHGEDDQIVSINQAQTFCAAKPCELNVLAGRGHFDVIDPRHGIPDLIIEHIQHWAND